jgi:LysM repeat protein
MNNYKSNFILNQLFCFFIFLLFLCSPFSLFAQVDDLDLTVENGDTTIIDFFYSGSSHCKKIDSIINFALAQRGKTYKYGSMGPDSFDCSGLMYYVFKHFNIQLNRSSHDQYLNGKSVDRKSIQSGDLVFFLRGKSLKKYIGHVGLVISVDSNHNFVFVHATSQKYGIRIDNSTNNEYASSYYGARRVVDCETVNESTATVKATIKTENQQVFSQVKPVTTNSSITYYKVKQGDTLFSISKKYKVSIINIKNWNNLKSDLIREGQQLKIIRKRLN